MNAPFAAVTFVALSLCARVMPAQDSLVFKGADRETRAALVKIVGEASARGLPADHIVARVQFALGVVHAPAARVLETARAVADRLETARGAIANDTLPGDIVAGEEALSFKIPKGILTRIHRAAPGASIAVPIGVLTQLVASEVPPERAGDIVTELMRRGATMQQLVALGNDVNSDVQRGAKGRESADIRFHGLNPLLSPNAANAADLSPPTISSSGPKKP